MDNPTVKPFRRDLPWSWADFGSGMMLVTEGDGAQVILCATKEMGVGKKIQPLLSTRDEKTGRLRPLTPEDEVAKLIETAPRLRWALQGARQAIADAPDNTWGHDSAGDPEVPGGRQMWTRKEEYLFHIDAVLGGQPGAEITKLDLAWERINALGGNIHGPTLDVVLNVIEELGGSDPAPKRKEQEHERQRRQEGAHR